MYRKWLERCWRCGSSEQCFVTSDIANLPSPRNTLFDRTNTSDTVSQHLSTIPPSACACAALSRDVHDCAGSRTLSIQSTH